MHRIILLLLLAATLAAKGEQKGSFRTFTAADGLSDNTVLCGLRDSYGFLWLGTPNGLNCFDGVNNVVYRNMVDEKVALENNIVVSLMEYDHDIWYGGTSGLYVYHRFTNTFSRFTQKTKYGVVISSTVQKLLRTRSGNVWICTLGQGVFVYRPQTGQLSQHSLYGGFAGDVCQGDDGLVYVSMINGRLAVFKDDGEYVRSYAIPSYANEKTHICIQHVGNDIWLGSDAGFYHLNRQGGTIEKFDAPMLLGTIHSIVAASREQLLLGTSRGVFAFDIHTRQFTHLGDEGTPQGIGLLDVNQLLVDQDNTLWLMTNMNGVSYLPRQQELFDFHTMAQQAAQGRMLVETFCDAGNGNLWIGTSDGLYRYDRETHDVQPYGGEAFRQPVTALLLDDDDLWVGTAMNGIKVVNLRTGDVRSYVYSDLTPYTVTSNEIRCLYKTRKGEVVVGTTWGLCRYDRSTEHFMSYRYVGSMIECVAMAEDADGVLWIATANRGVFRYRTENDDWHSYTYNRRDPHSLSSNSIVDIYCDTRGQVWFATMGGGLCRYDKESDAFVRVGEDSNVYFMAEDGEQNLWFATETGVQRMGLADGQDISHVATTGELWHGQLVQRASYYSDSGTMFMGSMGGYYTFKPDQVRLRTSRVPVYIASVTLPYISDSHDELERLGINGPLYLSDGIELPYRDNSFTLHFAAPRFDTQPDVRYEYMLEGVDKQWSHGSGTAEATYANVAPGKYTFLLREAGNADESKVARLAITVLPPWYRTTWAYLAYLLLAGLAIYYLVRRTQERMRRGYEMRMKEFSVEQEKKMYESKINFFVNLVHEIRTPLSLIALPLERMEGQAHGAEDRRYMSIIRKNMNYLLGITNQLLDFQKVENSEVQLNRANCSLKELLKDVYEQFSSYIDVEGKKITLDLPTDDIVTAIDRDRVNKIMMNLMSNALKYTRTVIRIHLSDVEGGMARIAVADDGPGVPDEEKERIFETFYQVSQDRIASLLGTGLGLAYAKTLAKAHGGDLMVEDAEGGGSVFVLTLPIEQVEQAAETPVADAPQVVDVQAAAPLKATAAKGFYVLLVEDNAELLNLTAETLQQWYHVIKATDGVEALRELDRQDVDVIVSDVMMPRMDGIELCQRVKGDINYSHIPFVLLTAKTTVESKVEGMQSGADVYMEKPFSVSQLHLQIENLLRLRQSFHNRMSSLQGDVEAAATSEYGMSQQNIQFLERIQTLIDENLSNESFSIDSLAEEVNMSRSSFYRKLKGLLGMTPVDFMKTRRLNHAAALLTEGVAVSEAADRVGFTSPSYFTKCFKQQFGVLPKDYVAQQRRAQTGSEKNKNN